MGYTAVVILILLRAAVRHETVSYVLFVAVGTIVFLFRGEYLLPELLFAVTQATLCVVVLVRFGVLSAIVLAFCWQAVQFLPIALEMSQWYSNQIVLSLAILIGIAAYGVYAATLGQMLPARFVGE